MEMLTSEFAEDLDTLRKVPTFIRRLKKGQKIQREGVPPNPNTCIRTRNKHLLRRRAKINPRTAVTMIPGSKSKERCFFTRIDCQAI
jgi:hypothetical protein